MTNDEIIRAAKEASEPALHAWIDYTWDTCRDSIVDEGAPVQTLIDWAQTDAENEDWELPADREQREKAETETQHEAWLAAKQAIEEAVEKVKTLIGGLNNLEISEVYESASSHSTYLTVVLTASEYGESIELRISDHPAPEYGGFDPERQERRGRADFEVIITPGAPVDLERLTRFLESHSKGTTE